MTALKAKTYFVPFAISHYLEFYERVFAGQMIRVYIYSLGLRWVLPREPRNNEKEKKLEFEFQLVPEPGETTRARNRWFEGEFLWETCDGFLKVEAELLRPLGKVELAPWIAKEATVEHRHV